MFTMTGRETTFAVLSVIALSLSQCQAKYADELKQELVAVRAELERAQACPCDSLDEPAERVPMLVPIACAQQWIRSWGDGRSPYERQKDGSVALRCVSLDLRGSP
jgi:hypothetical protein